MYQRVIALGEDVTMTGARLLPNANANLAGSKTKRNLIGFNFPNSSTSFTSESFSSGINISWELDLWGKLKNAKMSSSKKFKASLHDFESARLSLNGQVAKVWFNLLENHHQNQLLNKTIDTYSQNLDFINNRFVKGLATALEQKLALASYKSSKAALAKSQRLQTNLSNSLNELIGGEFNYNLDLNSTLTLPSLNVPSLPPTPSTVITSRYDVIASMQRIEASGFDLKVARKNLLPSFTISGNPGSRSDNFENLIDQKFRVWDVSGGISQPLFQAGRLRAGIRKAEALQNAAIQNYKAAVLKAFYEIENTLTVDSQFAEEEKNLKEASIALNKAAELSWERYQKGLDGIFNTLETRRRAFDAQSRFLSLKKERILNRINLYIAMGMNAVATSS